MKVRSALILCFTLLSASIAFAQDPKTEITGYYSYFRFNPENSGTLNSHSLNGGGGEISFFFSRMIGVKAEFAGYQGNKVTFTSGSVSASATASLFTYNVGPVIKLRSGHFEPFGEVLFGGAHSSFYSDLCKTFTGCVSNNPSNNAFDFVMGGGIDIPFSHSIAFRPVQADYVLTRFGNGFTSGNQNQSNFRYQAGIQVRF
jgi:outer membrane protein with beta-barrel domain